MTRDQATETLKSLVGSTGQKTVDLKAVWDRFAAIESALRCVYPCLPFHHDARKKELRVCFGWDGLRLYQLKIAELPVLTGSELELALDAIVADALAILLNVYP